MSGLVVLSGSDRTVAEAFRAGVHGVVSALANFVPELVEAVAAGRAEQAELSRLRDATKAVPQRAALKALVAEVTGVPRSGVRPPQAELEPDEIAALRAVLTGVPA